MVTIRKTGEGYYLVLLPNGSTKLQRSDCHNIKKDVNSIIKPHREISIDFKGIKTIESQGINILIELKSFSESKKCKLRFINLEHALSKKMEMHAVKDAPLINADET